MSMTLGRSPSVESLIRKYEAKFPKAIARALNRAGTSTRSLMSTLCARDLGLKTGTVKEQMKISNATPTRHVVRISASGARIPLIDFRASGGRRGVTARLPAPGAGRYPHAFIFTTRSGHRGVFERYDSGGRKGRRGPRGGRIYQLHGPSVPHVFSKFTPQGLARGEESLTKNLASELKFASSQS